MDERAHPLLYFSDCVLDRANAQVLRGAEVISLRPKSFAVLAYLVEHPGQLVTRDELFAAVWSDTAVTDWVLTGCVRELRVALADDPRQPRMIETAHRRGYRFIAAVRQSATETVFPSPTSHGFRSAAVDSAIVGRNAELDELHRWLHEALAHRRQVCFIAGEPGIGKTTLIDEFLNGLGTTAAAVESSTPTPPTLPSPSLLLARGQCVDQYGIGEPYLPVFEAIGRLCNGPDGAELIALLRRHAPSWLLQLPGLIATDEAEALERRLGAGGSQRMLREMTAFIEALPRPLVLVLEDLHWSDHATLLLLSALAQRRDPARLLLVGSYRPVDVALGDHPLKTIHHELRIHGMCRDLWLRPLDEAAVEQYLRRRWGDFEGLEMLAHTAQHHTDGNPLFLVNVANALVEDGVITQENDRWQLHADVATLDLGVPNGLRQLIAARNERLGDDEREILAAGSLVGRSFSAALVGAALDRDVLAVESRLARLAQRGEVVHAAGESTWPDGTVAGAYRFLHALYQTVIRERVSPALRQRLHGRIAGRLETAYGQRVDLAAELAVHFEAAGQPDRAVPHIEAAADRALRLGAGLEAVTLLRRGIALLDGLPPTPERTHRVIQLSIALGRALPSTQGFNQPEIEQAYQRARLLSEQTQDQISLIHSLAGLATFSVMHAKFDQAAEAADGIARLSEQLPVPLLVFARHFVQAMVRFHIGPLTEAHSCLDAAIAIENVSFPAFSFDPRVAVMGTMGLTLLHQGFVDQARTRIGEARERAAAGGRTFDRVSVLQAECMVAMLLRDYGTLATVAEELRALDEDNAFAPFGRGVCIAYDGDAATGLELMRAGIDAYHAAGYVVWRPFLLAMLAGALADTDEIDAGLRITTDARTLVDSTRDQRVDPELHRIEGVLRSKRNETDAADRCLRHAIAVAQQHGARWWELRATTSWARLALSKGHSSSVRRAALDALTRIVDELTEGADTADVKDARRTLSQLRRNVPAPRGGAGRKVNSR